MQQNGKVKSSLILETDKVIGYGCEWIAVVAVLQALNDVRAGDGQLQYQGKRHESYQTTDFPAPPSFL
jgi:hypothetical protein